MRRTRFTSLTGYMRFVAARAWFAAFTRLTIVAHLSLSLDLALVITTVTAGLTPIFAARFTLTVEAAWFSVAGIDVHVVVVAVAIIPVVVEVI